MFPMLTIGWFLRSQLAVMLAIGVCPIEICMAESADRITLSDVQVTLIADVHAPARETGVLATLEAKEGMFVEKGQVIGKLDTRLASMDKQLAGLQFDMAQLQSENDVDRRYAEKSLNVAEAEHRRSLDSFRAFPKSISKTEIDRRRLVVEQSRLAIEQADRDLQVASLAKNVKQQQLDVALVRLKRHEIVSPTTGMVVQVLRHPGEWLDQGEPIVRVIQLNRLRIEAFVDGSRHGSELLDRPVTFTTQLPPGDVEKDFTGRIVFVSPEMHPVNGQIRIWAEVDNDDHKLRPGARGILRIDSLRMDVRQVKNAEMSQ